MDKYLNSHDVDRESSSYKPCNLQDGEIVKIKKLKGCTYFRKINSLIHLTNHPNIVKLENIIDHQANMFLVFESMECSLYDRMIIRKKPFPETEIKTMCFQIFQGLAHMHHNRNIHGDLKPSNLLLSNNVIKIGGYGFPSHNVKPLFYRAPEVFLQSPVYDYAVDMWAMGAIMAELFTFNPLFQGYSEVDVMYKICKVLGSPTETTWPNGLDLASKMMYQFPVGLFGYQFSALLPYASADAVNLVASLLAWDPSMRPTAMDALQHPFFDSCYHVPRALRHEPPIVTPSLIRAPILFRMAMERELSKEEASLRSHAVDSGANEDVVRMLPEYLFDFEIEKESKFRVAQRWLWSGLSNAWVASFARKYLLCDKWLMRQC